MDLFLTLSEKNIIIQEHLLLFTVNNIKPINFLSYDERVLVNFFGSAWEYTALMAHIYTFFHIFNFWTFLYCQYLLSDQEQMSSQLAYCIQKLHLHILK